MALGDGVFAGPEGGVADGVGHDVFAQIVTVPSFFSVMLSASPFDGHLVAGFDQELLADGEPVVLADRARSVLADAEASLPPTPMVR